MPNKITGPLRRFWNGSIRSSGHRFDGRGTAMRTCQDGLKGDTRIHGLFKHPH